MCSNYTHYSRFNRVFYFITIGIVYVIVEEKHDFHFDLLGCETRGLVSVLGGKKELSRAYFSIIQHKNMTPYGLWLIHL